MSLVRALSGITLVAAIACGRTSAPPDSKAVIQAASAITASRNGSDVVIHNGSGNPIMFATLDRYYFDTALASYCFGNANCGSLLRSSQSSTVPISTIAGVSPSSQSILVFWWTIPDEPTAQPPIVSQIVVPLS